MPQLLLLALGCLVLVESSSALLFDARLRGRLEADRMWGRLCMLDDYDLVATAQQNQLENTPRSVFRQLITYATSRSVVSSALAFGARRFSSMAMAAFSLRALRLRANTG